MSVPPPRCEAVRVERRIFGIENEYGVCFRRSEGFRAPNVAGTWLEGEWATNLLAEVRLRSLTASGGA